MKSTSPLNEKQWLESLISPSTDIRLELGGYQSRFTPIPGWDTGLRRINEHLLYFVAEGRCSAVLNGKRIWPAAGSLCWICPTTPFRFFYGTPDKATSIYRFRFKVERRARPLRPKWSHQFLPEAWKTLDIVKQIILEVERPGRFGHLRIRSLLLLLSVSVFEAHPFKKRLDTVLNDDDRSKIALLVAENTTIRRTPAELARYIGLSSSYFSKIFRRSYGLSPRSWLLQQRLRHAAMLLQESSCRISEVAEQMGYSDSYLFSRQFRQMFGASPKQWRRSNI